MRDIKRYEYYLCLKEMLKVLDALYVNWDEIEDISTELNDYYHRIAKRLYVLEKDSGEIHLGMDFRIVGNLHGNQRDIRKLWNKIRYDVVNEIKSMTFTAKPMQINSDLSHELATLDKFLYEHIKTRNNIVSDYPSTFANGVLSIDGKSLGFKKNSKRAKVVGLLHENKGELVSIKELAQITGYKEKDVPSVVKQLNDKFRPKFGAKCVIKATGKGGYVLVIGITSA